MIVPYLQKKTAFEEAQNCLSCRLGLLPAVKTKTVEMSLNPTLATERMVRAPMSLMLGGFMSFGKCLLTKVKRENIMLTVCVPANFGLFGGRTIREPFGSRHCPPAPGLSHLLTQLFTRVSQISSNYFLSSRHFGC